MSFFAVLWVFIIKKRASASAGLSQAPHMLAGRTWEGCSLTCGVDRCRDRHETSATHGLWDGKARHGEFTQDGCAESMHAAPNEAVTAQQPLKTGSLS